MWMSALIISRTKKILSINLVQSSNALLAVKGNALSTLPSMIWGILPRLKDESEAKKDSVVVFFSSLFYMQLLFKFISKFFFLSFTSFFFLFFHKCFYQLCLYHADTDAFMYIPRARFWAVTDGLC